MEIIILIGLILIVGYFLFPLLSFTVKSSFTLIEWFIKGLITLLFVFFIYKLGLVKFILLILSLPIISMLLIYIITFIFSYVVTNSVMSKYDDYKKIDFDDYKDFEVLNDGDDELE